MIFYVAPNHEILGRPVVKVSEEDVARAIATADEQHYSLVGWDERQRLNQLARAPIEAMGGEPACRRASARPADLRIREFLSSSRRPT